MKKIFTNPNSTEIVNFIQHLEGRATKRTVSSFDVETALHLLKKFAPNAFEIQCDYSTDMRGGWQYVASVFSMKRISEAEFEVKFERGTMGGRKFKWYVLDANPSLVSVEYPHHNSNGVHTLLSIKFK